MKLWTQWLQAVRLLRPACQRSLTFVWMAVDADRKLTHL